MVCYIQRNKFLQYQKNKKKQLPKKRDMNTAVYIDVPNIINNLPSIDLHDSLDWDVSDASYSNDDYEIEVEDLLIIASINISLTSYTIQGDRDYPSEFVERDRSVDVEIKNIYGDDGDEIQLPDDEITEITKAVIESINF